MYMFEYVCFMVDPNSLFFNQLRVWRNILEHLMDTNT